MPRSSVASRRWRSHSKSLRHLARSLPRGDPSRTGDLVRTYQSDLNGRWRDLDRVITKMIVEDDVLGIGDNPPRVVLQIQPASRFDFPTDIAGKAAAFSLWLRTALDQHVLEIIGGSPTGWQNKYIRAAYSKGVDHADRALSRLGADVPRSTVTRTFNRPIHSRDIALAFGRNFRGLKGITDAVDATLSRLVAEALVSGLGPRELARRITRSIGTIGIVRSNTLARTEIINVHATSTLNRFAEAGVREVVGFAEFLTAGDDRVCQSCLDLEGSKFNIDEARGIIPVHPSCRCVWLPVITR